MNNSFQVAVIGAGPVGLFASSLLGMLGLVTCVFESQSQPGGQCLALYAQKPVYGVPALPGIKAEDLVTSLYNQANSSGNVEFFFDTCVQHVERQDRVFALQTSLENFQVQAILIAAGAGAFTPCRLGLDNQQEFEGRSLFYHVQTPQKFHNQRIVIVGGGNAAIDWALELYPHVKSLDIIHRRDQFRCNELTLQKLKQHSENVRFHTPFRVTKLQGQNGQISLVTVQHLKDTEELRQITADSILVFFGLLPNLQFLDTWGITQKDQHICICETDGSTNIPGIFAAGDIVTYDHKINILATGFGEAAKAAYAVKAFLTPSHSLNACHSQALHQKL